LIGWVLANWRFLAAQRGVKNEKSFRAGFSQKFVFDGSEKEKL